MKIGLFTNCFFDKSWEDICSTASKAGFDCLEIGTGALHGKNVCDAGDLLKNKIKLKDFLAVLDRHNLKISSFSCMGNYLHPDKEIAGKHRRDLEDAIELAFETGVNVVNGFAGCPGAAPDAKYPCWIGLPYPTEFQKYLRWQWDERIIPFWREMAAKLKKYGIRYAFEMHPGDAVFNTSSLLKLRDAAGYEGFGCCFDPTHLFWQGMDPLECVKRLKGLIFNVHAQDSELNMEVISVDGVLDSKDYGRLSERAWNLRLIGYGHGEDFWRKLVSTLRLCGYDDILSVEHQDALIGKEEGFKKAIDFIRKIAFFQKPDEIRY